MQKSFVSRLTWQWVAALVFSVCAHATTVVPPTFAELAEKADLVFAGKAVGSHSEWAMAGAKRVIYTTVDFQVEEVMKGDARKTVSLRFLGGTADGATMEITGMPQFRPGDRVMLFVNGKGTQFCPLVGFFHGKFNVRKDEKSGADIILRHDGRPLHDTGEIGEGDGILVPQRAKPVAPGAAPLTLEAFKAKVREHLKNKATK